MLACAYSRAALFSYRIYDSCEPSAEVEPFGSSRLCSGGQLGLVRWKSLPDTKSEYLTESISGIKQGRLDVIESLLTLGPHKFNPSRTDNINIDYDVVYLEESAALLLACHGQVLDPRQNHQLSVDQSFILRQREFDEGDRCVHPFDFTYKTN
jgi:hypothetical protein